MPLREPIAHDRPIARAKKLMFVACFLKISAESLLKHRLSALLYIIPKAGSASDIVIREMNGRRNFMSNGNNQMENEIVLLRSCFKNALLKRVC